MDEEKNQETQENVPKVDSPEVASVKDDLGAYMAVEGLASTEGGKVLLLNLQRTVASDVETVISLFRGSDVDLRCAVAKLSADLTLYRVLKRAPENARLAKEELAKLLEIEKD